MFDEMKIKEGLIWSQHTNRLLVFTDIECMQDRGDKEFLGSNILHFFPTSYLLNLPTLEHTYV